MEPGKVRVQARAASARAEHRPSPQRRRPTLGERLWERRAEIEAEILARVQSVEDPAAVADPTYLQGLREAVHGALEYAIAVVEGSAGASDPLLAGLAAQARLAARHGVALETVLLRYLAGHALLCDFLLAEAGPSPPELRRALRAQTALLERILAAVTRAYREEIEDRHRSGERRRTEQVTKLLAGEPLDVELGYDLELWHLGVAASGAGAPRALRELAAALDRRLLAVRPGGEEVWAWLGGSRKLSSREARGRAGTLWPAGGALAIGEPGQGVEGWRATHRQAVAALPIARHQAPVPLRYGDVALLAAALRDPVLAGSLRDSYLAPLEAERDGGAALRETLAAYLDNGRNASSAAAALGVGRNTVSARLRAVEEKLDRPLRECAAELQTALRLRELGQRQAGMPRHA